MSMHIEMWLWAQMSFKLAPSTYKTTLLIMEHVLQTND